MALVNDFNDLQDYVQVEISHTLILSHNFKVIKSQIVQVMVHKHMYHVTPAKNSLSRLFRFYLQYLHTTNSTEAN